MAPFYVGGDRDQQFLLPVSMADWLEEGHLAWFVIDVVAQIDTARFHAKHPNDGVGRPSYGPDVMLALLFYAYATGLRSSRRIEAACRTDAAYRVICGQATPDHATICSLVVDHEAATRDTFVAVLGLCAEAGLVCVGTIAIDGTKMAADAADQNRSRQWLTAEVAKILAEAKSTDVAGDADEALFGLPELPAALATKNRRLASLKAALAVIDAADAAEAKARAEKAQAAAREGRKLTERKPKDPHAALARAEAEHTAAVVAAEATPTARVGNTTDPDSRIRKTAKGWGQGFNAQAAANANQIVLSCDVSQAANDVGPYEPMVQMSEENLGTVGVTEPVGLVTADAGCWSEDNATADGPDRLIATQKDWKQRRAAREMGTTRDPARRRQAARSHGAPPAHRRRCGHLRHALTHHRAGLRGPQGEPRMARLSTPGSRRGQT